MHCTCIENSSFRNHSFVGILEYKLQMIKYDVNIYHFNEFVIVALSWLYGSGEEHKDNSEDVANECFSEYDGMYILLLLFLSCI